MYCSGRWERILLINYSTMNQLAVGECNEVGGWDPFYVQSGKD